ncbi:MAG TPA: GspE/PulE family protein [Myxococcales bacterium]|nr:GspE/PulE family protein [Myxococcales bacterium]
MPRQAQRTKRDFTTQLVAQILVDQKLLSDGERRDILTREVSQRARLAKASTTGRGERREIGPIELIASFQLPLARGRQGDKLDEDRIVEVVAKALGFGHWKIDPLKLDMALITRLISRPFARKHVVLPLRKTEQPVVLEVLVGNPFDIELFESLRQLAGLEIRPVLSSPADILRCVTEIYGFKHSIGAAEEEQSGGGPQVDVGNLEQLVKLQGMEELEATDKPVISAVEYLLNYAFSQRASDVHIEPRREHTLVRMRIDGVLHQVYTVPKVVHAPIISRLKMLARMDIAEKRRPQDGRIKTSKDGKEVELRVSSVPVAFGEKIVIRIFEGAMQDLAEIGFSPEELEQFESWIRQPHGLVLVTGPTGSGKTSTLYGALKLIADEQVNVTTIEDPVEMVLENLNQINIQPKIELTFGSALRHVLRQDPDVVMVGEIRDEETAQNAVQAALTGHLVLSTVHTNDAATSISRLRDLGVPSFLLASVMTGSMAQRLVRTICSRCAKPTTLAVDQIAALGLGRPEDLAGRLQVQYGEGCPRCRGTGYYGRTGIFEMLSITPKVRSMIAGNESVEEISKVARLDGMRSLRENAVRKLAAGLTTFEEVWAATRDIEVK